jgi:hypothetical protein
MRRRTGDDRAFWCESLVSNLIDEHANLAPTRGHGECDRKDCSEEMTETNAATRILHMESTVARLSMKPMIVKRKPV